MKGIVRISLLFFFLKLLFQKWRHIIIICISLVNAAMAQQVNIKLYTSVRGLVYEDSNGYLWMGSVNGISRFDGKGFLNFGLKDGLPSLSAWVSLEDSHHRLWISSSKGMARLIGNKFVTYPLSDNLTIGYNFGITETSKKQIWAFTDKGVYQFNDSVWQKIKLFPGYENEGCRGIIETDSVLYVNYGSVLVYLNGENKWHIIEKHDYPIGPYFNLLHKHGNTLLISTRDAIYKIENNRLIPLVKGLKGTSYFTFFIDSRDRLWYYFTEGDKTFHVSEPGNWQRFNQQIPNHYGQATFISEDSHNNIWIGTQEGLLKIQQVAFSEINETNSTKIGGATNGFAMQDSALLLSTLYGLLVYHPNDSPNKYLSIDKKETIIDAWDSDEKKRSWFITRNDQLYQLHEKTISNFSFLLKPLHAGALYDCSYDERKKRLFIVCDRSLVAGNEKKMEVFIPANNDKKIPLFSRVLLTQNGETLLLDRSGSIFVIDKNDSLYEWRDNDQFHKSYTSFFEGPDGDIWLSNPRAGLIQCKFNSHGKLELIRTIAEKDGLQNQNILSMAFDSLKRIWIVSSMGLDILQKNRKGEFEIFNYSQEAGLQVNWSQSKLITDAKGDVWLTSWHKLVKFNCHELELKKEAPRVIIEKVQLNLIDVDWSKYTDSLYGYRQIPVNPKLNYKKNTVSFFFNGISFSSSPQLEYSYQLSTINKSWSPPASNASVSFVNLSPGNYIFKVKTRDQASAWSMPAEFSFTIIAPFWMKWWFIALCCIVAFGIIYGIYKYRINQVKRILVMRTKISRDLHDEVGSTLTSINILSKVSQSNLEKDKFKVADLLQKITEQSANMQQSMSDIVWSIRPDNDKLENLVIRMREYLGQTVEPRNLLVEFNADEKILKESLTMAQRQNIFLIYKEAVNNAVKYAQAKKICVFLGKENHHIKLIVEDDGSGFDPGKTTSSNGLKNMQERAKELRGTLNIHSSQEEGTRVELRCPAT